MLCARLVRQVSMSDHLLNAGQVLLLGRLGLRQIYAIRPCAVLCRDFIAVAQPCRGALPNFTGLSQYGKLHVDGRMGA